MNNIIKTKNLSIYNEKYIKEAEAEVNSFMENISSPEEKKIFKSVVDGVHEIAMEDGVRYLIDFMYHEEHDKQKAFKKAALKDILSDKICVKYYNEKTKLYNLTKKTIAEYYLSMPSLGRHRYDGITFNPKPSNNKLYNLFKGFKTKDIVDYKESSVKPFLDYIHEVIANGDKAIAQYVIKWLAHLVQKPEELPRVALVLLGGQGTGKGTFFDIISQFFYKSNTLRISNSNHLTGQFSGHLADKILVLADEVTWGGYRKDDGILKTIITEKYRTLENKYQMPVEVSNYVRLVINSNSDWVVRVEKDDRRYVVCNVSNKYQQNKSYFSKLHDFYQKEENLNHLYTFLNLVDISDFDITGERPTTEAYIDQKKLGWTGIESFVYSIIEDNYSTDSPKIALDGKAAYQFTYLYTQYLEYCRETDINPVSQHHFTIEFAKKIKFNKSKKQVNGSRTIIYVFDELEMVAKGFAEYNRCDVNLLFVNRVKDEPIEKPSIEETNTTTPNRPHLSINSNDGYIIYYMFGDIFYPSQLIKEPNPDIQKHFCSS